MTACFSVTDALEPAILGLPTPEKFSIVKLNCQISERQVDGVLPGRVLCRIADTDGLKRQYPEYFHGIGKFDGTYHITVDPNVPPIVHPPRRVPFKLKDDIQKELAEMEQQGIITKVRKSEPTE